MLRDGPIPRFVHGILEYLLGVLFIAAPFLFDFESGAATGMSVAIGVLILIFAAVSEGPVSLVNQLPLLLHVAMLYVLALFLIAAPFLLGFSDEVAPRNFFIISGVFLLLITIGTRFRRSANAPSARTDATRSAGSAGRAASPAGGQDRRDATASPAPPPGSGDVPGTGTPSGLLPPVPPAQSGTQAPPPAPPPTA